MRSKKTLCLWALVGCVACSLGSSRPPQGANASPVAREQAAESAAAEAAIRQRVARWAKALEEKDLDGVMSLYASDIESYDLDPPLRYVGADNKRRAWQTFFSVHPGPITYDIPDLRVATHGVLAVAYSLNHVRGERADGGITDLWVRWTACLRQRDGSWQVLHDHVSLPVDLRSGHAVQDLVP